MCKDTMPVGGNKLRNEIWLVSANAIGYFLAMLSIVYAAKIYEIGEYIPPWTEQMRGELFSFLLCLTPCLVGYAFVYERENYFKVFIAKPWNQRFIIYAVCIAVIIVMVWLTSYAVGQLNNDLVATYFNWVMVISTFYVFILAFSKMYKDENDKSLLNIFYRVSDTVSFKYLMFILVAAVYPFFAALSMTKAQVLKTENVTQFNLISVFFASPCVLCCLTQFVNH